MTAAQNEQIAAAMDALQASLGGLPDSAVCIAVLGFFADRPTNPAALDELANELGRLAHMQGRQRNENP